MRCMKTGAHNRASQRCGGWSCPPFRTVQLLPVGNTATQTHAHPHSSGRCSQFHGDQHPAPSTPQARDGWLQWRELQHCKYISCPEWAAATAVQYPRMILSWTRLAPTPYGTRSGKHLRILPLQHRRTANHGSRWVDPPAPAAELFAGVGDFGRWASLLQWCCTSIKPWNSWPEVLVQACRPEPAGDKDHVEPHRHVFSTCMAPGSTARLPPLPSKLQASARHQERAICPTLSRPNAHLATRVAGVPWTWSITDGLMCICTAHYIISFNCVTTLETASRALIVHWHHGNHLSTSLRRPSQVISHRLASARPFHCCSSAPLVKAWKNRAATILGTYGQSAPVPA